MKSTTLNKKGLIDVHILNICDCETPTIHFAEVEERTLGLTVIGKLHSWAGLTGWLALDPALC